MAKKLTLAEFKALSDDQKLTIAKSPLNHEVMHELRSMLCPHQDSLDDLPDVNVIELAENSYRFKCFMAV